MTVIFGLGNPTPQYAGTRHNAGFDVADRLAAEHKIEINRAKHRAHVGEGFIGTDKVMLVKPQTYMNLSGECVTEVLRFYKLTNEDIIVVYDDTSFDVGQIRIRKSGSAGGHNGVKNIIDRLGTDAFLRVKVGIGAKPPGWVLADYVTSKFKKEEQEDFLFSVDRAAAAVTAIVLKGADAAMNAFNVKL